MKADPSGVLTGTILSMAITPVVKERWQPERGSRRDIPSLLRPKLWSGSLPECPR